ncbi:ABC transporter B member 11 [Basidiobolus ranarum]|uniref:ABC transporter B member 11 n=1 Tax=Basidiobolus ranarum TaxID=34480 RepID=A0ABR2W9A4_9FUNG
MALALLSALALLAAVGGLISRLAAQNTTEGQQAYASAGAVTDEVISSIKMVSPFGGQKREILRYNSNLDIAENA